MDDKKKNHKPVEPEAPEVMEEIDVTEEVAKLNEEVTDLKNKYLRALADYQNLEKRVSEERFETRKLAQISVLSRFLPIIDNIQQAEVFVKDAGLKIVQDNFMKILTELGLKEIDVLNKEYDPHTAEVVDIVQGDKDNIVVEVLRKGYELDGKVLRPAQVKVSKKVEN